MRLAELIAMQPRHRRGSLMPGERFPSGMRPGRRRAQGVELDGIGPYVPGDDLRSMDWRATARTGRAQMKRFIAESHLARMLIVDMRAHMFFGTATRPMAKTAALVAAQIAWEGLALHEPLGLIVLPEPEVIRPRRGRVQTLRLLDHLVLAYERLNQDRVEGTSHAAAEALEVAAAHLRRGDEVCLLSDFGESASDLAETARQLSSVRSLRAVVIEDEIFSRPVPSGRYPFKTAGDESRSIAVISRALAARHAETVASLRSSLRKELVYAGWRVADVARASFLTDGRGS